MGKTEDSIGDSTRRDLGGEVLRNACTGRLFERDGEVRRLEAALAQLHLGVGGCILIRGLAGTGKTRLVDTLAASARATDLPVWHSSGGPTWQGQPLLALRQTVGGIEPPPSVPENLFDLVAEIEKSAAARVPRLLVIDDLHTADRATLTALGELARHVEQLPLLLLLAYRGNLLGELPAGFERATTIELGPLSSAAAEAYADHLVGGHVGPRLRRALPETGGLPMHLWLWLGDLGDRGELVREGGVVDLADPAAHPGELRELALARRRAMIGPQALDLLRPVAVMGRRFRLQDLAAMVGLSAEATVAGLRPLLAARGAVREGDWWLIRWQGLLSTLHDRLPPAERAGLHRRYARLLEARAGPPVTVAEHYLASAGPGDREAVAAARRAAAALGARFPELAAHLLRRAVDLLPPGDPDRTATAVELADAELGAGNLEAACRLGEEALAGELSPALRGRGELCLLAVYASAHRAELEDLAQAMLARPGLEDDLRRAVLARRALQRMTAGRLHEADADARAVLAETRRPPDEAASLAVTALAAMATLRGDPERALGMIQGARLAAPGSPLSAGLANLAEAEALSALDRFDETLSLLHATLRELDRAGSPKHLRALVLDGIADAYYGKGAWDAALAEWQVVLGASAEPASPTLARARRMRALIAARRGDLGPAEELSQRRRAAQDAGGPAPPEDLGLDAILLDEQGDPAAAGLTCRRTRAAWEARGDSSQVPGWLPWEIRFARHAGASDTDLARLVAPIADRLLDLTRRWTTEGVSAAAALARGVRDRNAAALAQAAARYRQSPRAADRGVGCEVCGEELLRLGQPQLGVAALLGALDDYRALGADPSADRVSRRLRELGVRRGVRRPRVRPEMGWESLTPEELRVAALVSSGLSNPEIAERVGLSRRHVTAILEQVIVKLGAPSRLELGLLVARRARDQEVVPGRNPQNAA